MRTKEALALRKPRVSSWSEKGSYTKMNVLIENRKVIVGMLKRNCTIADICGRFDISRDTFMKFRSRYKEIDKAMKERDKTERELQNGGYDFTLVKSFVFSHKITKHELSTKNLQKNCVSVL